MHTSDRQAVITAGAALAAVRRVSAVEREYRKIRVREGKHKRSGTTPGWVVTTDSEYVVKGMTEWLPKWKVGLPRLARMCK